MGWLSSLKKSVPFLDPFDIFSQEDSPESIARPKYYEDQDYRQTQDALKGFSLDLLKGVVPEYYQGLGQSGSQEFEQALSLSNRDLTRSYEESAAKSGRLRGGASASILAPAIAENSINARYKDYERALSGKGDLLKLGVGTAEGVRGAGQTEGTYRNNFNWKDYGAQVDERNFQLAWQQQQDEQLGELLGTVASVGLGAATGGMSFGVQGAMAGGADALMGGGTDFLGLLTKSKNPAKASAGLSDWGAIDAYLNGEF